MSGNKIQPIPPTKIQSIGKNSNPKRHFSQFISLMEKNNYSASPNLINKVQILLKKEAGFESFLLNDPSLNPPPSPSSSLLDEGITGLNPSTDALRCKNCKGVLLRGPDSIICVYCGRTPLQNCHRHPISYKNSLAFQWFLKSLDLDGLERVGVPVRGDQFGDRGRGSVKEEEIFLPDFLDLELKWLEESRGFGVENEERVIGKRYLSLVGVDIEEILAQEGIDHGFSVRDEQEETSWEIGNEESGNLGERSLSLFENTQSTEAGLRLGEGENDESFSDWGAEFQSAIPDSGHEKLANISIVDATLGSNLTTSSNNLWGNLELGPHLNPEVSDGNNLVEGSGKAVESVDASFDCLPADERPTAKNDSPNNEKRDGDDSFDDWGDFRMSMNANATQCEPSSTSVPGNDSNGGVVSSAPFDDFTDFVVSKDMQLLSNSFQGPADGWNNFTTSSTGGEIQLQTISNKPEQHDCTGDRALGGEIDLALLDVTYLEPRIRYQGIDVDKTQDKISDQGDSIGICSNDIHSGIKGELDELQGKDSKLCANATSNEHSNSFDLWNDFKGSDNQQQATNKEVADNKMSTEDVSTFDAWNDFTGLGVGEKEEQAGSLEVVDVKGREGNDHSIDAWSDFAGSSGVFDNKPITNDISSAEWNGFSSMISSNQPQISNTRTSEDQAVLKDDDLFSSWGDFRSLGTQIGNSSLGLNGNKTSSDQISFQKAPNSLITVEDYSTFSSWGDLGGATSNLEQQLQAAGAGSSEIKMKRGDGDLFSGSGKQFSSQPDSQLLCDVVTKHYGESTCENDNSFDTWSDFTSSSIVQANLSSSANALDDKEAVKHGDLFDAWNVIVSSPNVQAGKDIGVFSHPNGSVPVAFSPPEGPELIRTEHGDVKADGYANGMNPSERTSKEALDLKSSVVETLISEMHDLSFMLQSSLSYPSSGG